MPTLPNLRHEAFAQARARGALLIEAHESAGFARDYSHPSRLARKPEMAERIADQRRIDKNFKPFTASDLCDEPPPGRADRAQRRPAAAPSAPRQRPFSAQPAPRVLPRFAPPAPGGLPSCAPASPR